MTTFMAYLSLLALVFAVCLFAIGVWGLSGKSHVAYSWLKKSQRGAFGITVPDLIGGLIDPTALFGGLIGMCPGYVNITGAAGVTITAVQLLSGILVRTGGTTENDTTDTATNIIGNLTYNGQVPRIGQTFMFTYTNINSGTTTLVAGTGVTLTGTTTILTTATRVFIGTVTGTLALSGANTVGIQGCYAFTASTV